MAWMWESIRPGMTVRPPRSMTRVAGPASARMSAELPIAAILPSRTASACAGARVIDDDLAVEEDGVGGLGVGAAGNAAWQASDRQVRPNTQAPHASAYSRCKVHSVSMNMSLAPGGVRRKTLVCL